MNVRGPLPIKRIINAFGAVGYTLLLFVYAIISLSAVVWLMRRGKFFGLSVNLRTAEPLMQTVPTEPEPLTAQLLSAALGIATALVLVITLTALTYWLGRGGSRMLKRSVRFCQCPVTLVTLLVGKVLACGVATVPVLLAGILQMGNLWVVIILLVFITVALIIFLLQHYLAHTSEVVQAKDVW